MRNFVAGPLPQFDEHITVSFIFEDRRWYLDRISISLPNSITNKIISIDILDCCCLSKINDNTTWNTFFTFASWQLWLNRNHRLYSPTQHHNTSLNHSHLHTIVNEYIFLGPDTPNKNHRCTEPIPVTWSSPHHPYITLNTNDSAVPNPGKGGIGGIFRDSIGAWLLGFAKAIPHATNLQAELLAIKEGLKIATSRQYRHIRVQSDSAVALYIMKNNTNGRMKYLVDDYRSLIRSLNSVKLQHIFRDVNRIADTLATQGRISKSSILQLLEVPPTILAELLLFDNGSGQLQRFVKQGLG